MRYLATTKVQADEVWSYCYSKQKNVPEEFRAITGYGSVWTWTALDADSKLIISWILSDRSQEAADALIADLKSRTFHRLQITSDGHSVNIDALAKAFTQYGTVNYAEEIKMYETE